MHFLHCIAIVKFCIAVFFVCFFLLCTLNFASICRILRRDTGYHKHCLSHDCVSYDEYFRNFQIFTLVHILPIIQNQFDLKVPHLIMLGHINTSIDFL